MSIPNTCPRCGLPWLEHLANLDCLWESRQLQPVYYVRYPDGSLGVGYATIEPARQAVRDAVQGVNEPEHVDIVVLWQ